MKMYKIQTKIQEGWADLKVSDDGLRYVDDHYDTEAEAVSEKDSIVEATQACGGEYRVVPVDTLEDGTLYDRIHA